jgi:hypothetical protein
MGLINTDDIKALEKKATLQPIAEARLARVPADMVAADKIPHGLFREKDIHDPNVVPAQPVALKTAMSALRKALKQPMTDYSDEQDFKQYTRDTRNSLLSRKPKHPFELSQAAGGERGDADYAPGQMTKKYKQGGLPEPAKLKELRQNARDVTMGRIDQVLDDLNVNTENFKRDDPASSLSIRDTLQYYRASPCRRPRRYLVSCPWWMMSPTSSRADYKDVII